MSVISVLQPAEPLFCIVLSVRPVRIPRDRTGRSVPAPVLAAAADPPHARDRRTCFPPGLQPRSHARAWSCRTGAAQSGLPRDGRRTPRGYGREQWGGRWSCGINFLENPWFNCGFSRNESRLDSRADPVTQSSGPGIVGADCSAGDCGPHRTDGRCRKIGPFVGSSMIYSPSQSETMQPGKPRIDSQWGSTGQGERPIGIAGHCE